MFEIGNSLREARLRQQLDFTEIEQATKIRGKYIRALEEETFDVLPAQTYVKGFLRTYADYLGLDGQLYVDEYNSRYVTGEDELPAPKPPRRRPHPGARRVEARGVIAAVGAIAVVSALVFAAWKFSGGGNEQKVPGLNAPRETATVHQKRQTAVVHHRRRAQPVKAKLVLTAENGNSWVRVQRGSAAGHQEYEGTLEQGQHLVFVWPRLYVRVGNPPALVATINGRRVDIPARLAASLIVTARGISLAPTGA